MELVLGSVAAMNVITFLLYGIDKWNAKKQRWRIPEKTLLGIAAIGGSVGAYIGMYVFRHKTRKAKFYIGVPSIIIIQICFFMYICQ